MLKTPDYPSLARVLPLPNETPATGFSWGDYEDVGGNDADDEGDGLGIVRRKRSSMFFLSLLRLSLHLAYITSPLTIF